MAEAPFVKKQLLTSAAGCRRDNLTTPRVATELRRARKFSVHFIETDIAIISRAFSKRRFNRWSRNRRELDFQKELRAGTNAP
jgi:hypothetical protein